MNSRLKWPSSSSIVELINDIENAVGLSKSKNNKTDEDDIAIISTTFAKVPSGANSK